MGPLFPVRTGDSIFIVPAFLCPHARQLPGNPSFLSPTPQLPQINNNTNPRFPFLPILCAIAGSNLEPEIFLWPDTRRADRYRVWLKKPADADFAPVATTAESDATLTALPVGVPLQLQITAANDAGESIPGPMSAITLT